MAYLTEFCDNFNQMQVDADKIIKHRMLMMTYGTMSSKEAIEMVAEKTETFSLSCFAGFVACGSGNPLIVINAMLKPYQKKTAENIKRLGISV